MTTPQTAEIVTGLSDFDALAGPIPRGQVTLVAARTSAGASAFALSVARHNDETGHHVAIASFQCGADQLMSDYVAATTSVNTDRPLTINKGRRARMERARAAIGQSRLWMWDHRGNRSLENLIKQVAALSNLDLLILDNYHLAASGELVPGATFTTLQKLACERNIGLLVTAYLDLPADGSETDLPAITELGTLSTPVAAAETVMFLHRPDRNGTVPQRRGEADLIAVRGWDAAGSATVRFEPEYHRFVDLPNT
ncbi:DnaB-like helicase C-terminal domain-containing protein [Streptomyces sp. NPDC056053]|uniref:DnaB-like helicase C-terminal domain-containing protein n=1 Tax=Streptomyces sp. NPDC056053 TaxID=3345696 RepID=UPI0035DACAD1